MQYLAGEFKNSCSDCKCGPIPGYFCASRVGHYIPDTPFTYLTGTGCIQNALYSCQKNGETAHLERICPATVNGKPRCTRSIEGNDFCENRIFHKQY